MVKDMQTIVNFCKSKGFMYQGSDIYGGIANVWDFGPLGCRLKNNIIPKYIIILKNMQNNSL